MTIAAVSLDDKYALESGRVYLTGTQALVRLPMMQRQRDAAAGLHTGAFISGYRGSPLGAYDMALWQARSFLQRNHIRFQPGVNEDLAATALWGSQQLNLLQKTDYDGVFGIWYGKGPGVDRCGDVFRHANLAGSAAHGGVLALLGDDHTAKSSTTAHQTEFAMADMMIPVLNPAGVQEFLDLGLHGWALSRFAGTWTGFKCVTMTVDSSASVYIDPQRVNIVTPSDFTRPDGGLNIRWPDDILAQEERLHTYKMAAAQAYARANHLDRVVIDSRTPRLVIVTTGKSYLDVRQALDDLGIDEALAAEIGIKLYKVALVWPLDGQSLRRFVDGVDEVVVVEEKRPLIEDQLKALMFGDHVRPQRIVGKFAENGQPLFPSHGEVSAERIAIALGERIGRFWRSDEFDARLKRLRKVSLAVVDGARVTRTPYFCSGCPHNSSTKVPEGSRALAGIGCHFMAQSMDRSTATFTHMGGEGVTWVGQAPFNGNQHVFVNLGDGTYFHSGFLAIRAARASGANMTYKILYNDAVAMTGGQPVDGQLTVAQIGRQLQAEGVKKVAVVVDNPAKYPLGMDFGPGTTIHQRDDLDAVQRTLRDTPGVTVLIYDQTCATEKRRRRKRGAMADPARRVIINESVCEGCGDCSVASNCVSVEPLETPYGRKRQINQSTCNKDFSCLKGFCPSFVTVEGGRLRRRKGAGIIQLASAVSALPTPPEDPLTKPFHILVTGIGGTGVVTIGALVGMAAHLEGKGCSVLDMVGIAQKGGPVLSHIKVAAAPDALHAVSIGSGGADALLGCDLVVAAGRDALVKTMPDKTQAVINSHATPVAQFVRDPNFDFGAAANMAAIETAVGRDNAFFVEGTHLATALFGDSIASNVFMLGVAFQKGLIPVSADALIRAIKLNGVAVDVNTNAFAMGRLAVHDPAALERAAGTQTSALPGSVAEPDLDALIAQRSANLTAYQDSSYAARYRALVEEARAAEATRSAGVTGFAEAVARYAFKLMAYKDEYEVARLHSDGALKNKIASMFEGDYTLRFHLAPPLLARRDPATGVARKITFGPYVMTVFRFLAKLKILRGTPFDVFGYTKERRTERQLIASYFDTIRALIADLDHDNHALAVQIAEIPEQIRGFGHVKARHLDSARAAEAELMRRFQTPAARQQAAE